jgi:hypothetical protein
VIDQRQVRRTFSFLHRPAGQVQALALRGPNPARPRDLDSGQQS